MDKKVVSGIVIFTVIIFIILYITKKPKCEPCKTCVQQITSQDSDLKYIYTDKIFTIPKTFTLMERSTGMYLGLCDNNVNVCLTKNNPLVLTTEVDYKPVFDTTYPIMGNLMPLKSSDGRYLRVSQDGNSLFLEQKPATAADERNYLFRMDQILLPNGLLTKTILIRVLVDTYMQGVTIQNGNIISIKLEESTEFDRIKAHHLWSVNPL